MHTLVPTTTASTHLRLVMDTPHWGRRPEHRRDPQRKGDVIARQLEVGVQGIRLVDYEVLCIVGKVRRFSAFHHSHNGYRRRRDASRMVSGSGK